MNTKHVHYVLMAVAAFGLFVTLPLVAQVNPPANPGAAVADPAAKAPQGNDPFTRNGQAAPVASPEKVAQSVIYGLVEYFEVPSEAWFSYSLEHPTRPDATELRAEVQRWVTNGKAKPLEITCVPTLSGNRVVIESVIERRYGIGFSKATPMPVPTTFETRNTHFTFEWEPIFRSELGILVSSCVPQIVTSLNGPQMRDLAKPVPNMPPQPRFSTTKPSLSIKALADQVTLMQVSAARDPQGNVREDARVLSFFRCAPAPLAKTVKPIEPMLIFTEGGRRTQMPKSQWEALKLDAAAKSRVQMIEEQLAQKRASFDQGSLTFEIERLAVGIADLNRWFAEKPLAAASSGLRAAAQDWVRAGRGREFDRISGPVALNQRSVWEDYQEIRYPMEYSIERSATDPNESGPFRNPDVFPATFETRNAGYSVEMEVVVAPEGDPIDFQIALNDTRHLGSDVVYQREVNGRLEPVMDQPVFASMKSSIGMAAGLGQTTLLGIHTPANDKVQPDPEQRILTFITFRN